MARAFKVLKGLLAATLLVSATPSFSQGLPGWEDAVFPPPNPHPSPTIRANQDYYCIYLERVYLDRDPSWWTKNDILVSVEVDTPAGPAKLPVYDRVDQRSGGLLGISSWPVLTYVPFSGTPVKIHARIVRKNSNDGWRKILSFLIKGTDVATSSLTPAPPANISVYASQAIPYLGLISRLADSAFEVLKPEDVLLDHQTSLRAYNGVDDAKDLRDSLVVFFQAKPQQAVGPLGFDGVFVTTTQGRLVDRPWIAFRIKKYTDRPDYAGRNWYSKLEAGLRRSNGLGVNDLEIGRALLNESQILLDADSDFTEAQKTRINSEARKNFEKIVQAQNQGKTQLLNKTFSEASVVPRTIRNDYKIESFMARPDWSTSSPILSLPALTRGLNSISSPAVER